MHRWAGLTMALFLIVAGATGILLPWEEELTLASRPILSRAAPPYPGARTLDGVTLAERAAAQTGGQIGFVPLDIPTDHVVRLSVQARKGQPTLGYDALWADPYTGQIRLKFRYGVLADGAQNIIPFLYEVHYSLALGAWGIWAFGVAALIWTLDCFVGFYLTLPMRLKPGAPKSKAGKSWWARWRPAWTVRKGARGHKLNFDLHRASGLWLWPLLLVFAWSSVGFCLPSVHRPVMTMLGASADFSPPTLTQPLDEPPIDLRTARRIGQQLVAHEGQNRGFRAEREGYLFYRPAWGLYGYSVRTTADPADEDAQTRVWFDARTGRLFAFQGALGENTADAVMRWFYMLHMAQVFGLPYRIFVSVLGLAVVALSITGIAIWMKKRTARLLGKRRKPSTRSVKSHASKCG
ncbi:MAG: PepSY-associated TM helix domain-containing protein [Novosphingobium sp.]